jgi:hypothetical protein
MTKIATCKHTHIKIIQQQFQILHEINTPCGFGRFPAWLWAVKSIIVQEFRETLLSASVVTKRSAALYRCERKTTMFDGRRWDKSHPLKNSPAKHEHLVLQCWGDLITTHHPKNIQEFCEIPNMALQ